MRDGIVFYRSFWEAVQELEDSDRLAAIEAIIQYGLDGVEPERGGVISAVFKLAKPQIDANNRKYENGKKGGAPKNQTITKQEPKQNQNVTKAEPNDNQTITKPEPKEKEKVKDKAKDKGLSKDNQYYTSPNPSLKEGGPKRPSDVFITFAKGNKDLLGALRDFEQTRRLNKSVMTDQSKTRLLASLKKLSADPAEQIRILNYATDHGWKSVYPVPDEKQGSRRGYVTRQEEMDEAAARFDALIEEFRQEEVSGYDDREHDGNSENDLQGVPALNIGRS